MCDDLKVEWANAQLNFVCIIHGLEVVVGGGGGGGWWDF